MLIHEYFEIDIELTWEIAQSDIPNLKTGIIKIKKELAQLHNNREKTDNKK